jgi:hypothetical protein
MGSDIEAVVGEAAHEAVETLEAGGQALNIVSPAYAAAALSIWSVEARHASVAGLLLKPTAASQSPNGAFDEPKAAAEVLKAVAKTGFLQ